MRLGIGQAQRRSPGATEHEPLLDTEQLPDPLHVGDQIPGRVLAQFGMRRRFAAATLVEQHNAVFLRIEELPIPGLGAATGAAMHEHRRDRSEEHTSELQSLLSNSYSVFC